MNHYESKNFDIYYKKYVYKIPTNLTIELMRKYYYQKIVNEFISQCKLNNLIFEDDRKTEIKLSEYFSYFITNKDIKDDNDDPVMSNKPNYKYKFIESMINKNLIDKKKITFFKKNLKKILHQCEKLMKVYFKEFKKNINIYDSDTFYIEKILYNDIIVLNIIQKNDFIVPIESFSYSIHISLYKHLIKIYSIRNFNEYIIPDNPPWISDFDTKVFILYTRYNYLSSGSTQASIKPQFKKLLTEKLNIKIELFASAINSSYTMYCSLFYDIEKFFGSLGSFFDTKIMAGYYEINPPFEKNIINKVFDKIYYELVDAEKNNTGLLFFLVLPKLNLEKIPIYSKIKKFEHFLFLYPKKDFEYIYYEKNFKYVLTQNIISTYIIIYHTSYIKPAVKRNIDLKNFLLK